MGRRGPCRSFLASGRVSRRYWGPTDRSSGRPTLMAATPWRSAPATRQVQPIRPPAPRRIAAGQVGRVTGLAAAPDGSEGRGRGAGRAAAGRRRRVRPGARDRRVGQRGRDRACLVAGFCLAGVVAAGRASGSAATSTRSAGCGWRGSPTARFSTPPTGGSPTPSRSSPSTASTWRSCRCATSIRSTTRTSSTSRSRTGPGPTCCPSTRTTPSPFAPELGGRPIGEPADKRAGAPAAGDEPASAGGTRRRCRRRGGDEAARSAGAGGDHRDGRPGRRAPGARGTVLGPARGEGRAGLAA